MVIPRNRRRAVEHLVAERGLSQRHVCQLVGLPRSSARYQNHLRGDESRTVALIRTYAEEQSMYGYRSIAAMLKQNGHQINRKPVYRIWRQEGLQVPWRHAVNVESGSTVRHRGRLPDQPCDSDRRWHATDVAPDTTVSRDLVGFLRDHLTHLPLACLVSKQANTFLEGILDGQLPYHPLQLSHLGILDVAVTITSEGLVAITLDLLTPFEQHIRRRLVFV